MLTRKVTLRRPEKNSEPYILVVTFRMDSEALKRTERRKPGMPNIFRLMILTLCPSLKNRNIIKNYLLFIIIFYHLDLEQGENRRCRRNLRKYILAFYPVLPCHSSLIGCVPLKEGKNMSL